MAIPIRLIRKDLQVINLDCTDYMMTVTRGIYVQPIPLTGERVGGDLNMVTSALRFDCIVRDDEDCTGADAGTASDVKASASIDFTTAQTFGTLSGYDTAVYMSGDSVNDVDGENSASDLDGCGFEITSTHTSTEGEASGGTVFTVVFDNGSGSGGSGTGGTVAAPIITVGISGANDAETLVTRIYDAMIEHSAIASIADVADANETELESLKLGVSKAIGTNQLEEPAVEGALYFEQVVAGTNGHTGTPKFTTPSGSTVPSPLVSPFSGGKQGECFSAGDKIQNLLGNVVSNTVLGAMGGFYNLSESLEGDSTTKHGQDYIIGVQVPYNSLVNTSSQVEEVGGVPHGYAARNFIYGTGFGNKDKDAVSNTRGASEPFDIANRMSGIRGTVVQCEINYEAAATVYKATITFQPLDVMMGI